MVTRVVGLVTLLNKRMPIYRQTIPIMRNLKICLKIDTQDCELSRSADGQKQQRKGKLLTMDC
jgi:hypothetical protein